MKLEVKKIKDTVTDALSAVEIMDRNQVPFQSLDKVNWEDSWPYRPQVEFRIAYTDNSLFLNFRVEEDSIRALAPCDNDKIWEDSCCECFIQSGNDDIYYNIECNCVGRMLMGSGVDRKERIRAGQDVLNTISRWSSLEMDPIEERVGKQHWQLSLVIPFSAFFRHNIKSMDEKIVKANFYKCGSKLPTPHYLSWNPVIWEKPDFHRPECFGELIFTI